LGGTVYAKGVDARCEDETIALFAEIELDIGPIEVVVFNIGANVRFGIEETTARVFHNVWEMACFAGFLAGREAAKVMVPRGHGTLIFTGATASLRGREGFAAFAAAKAGLRALAQSIARELGPKGIHVAHVVCDGSIDGVFSRQTIVDLEQKLAQDRILKPHDIAESYLACISRSARPGPMNSNCAPGAKPGNRLHCPGGLVNLASLCTNPHKQA